MSAPRIASTSSVVDRLDGGRAALVVEHRQLAEDVARAERRERDLAPVGVLADRPRVAACGRRSRCRSRRPRGRRPRRARKLRGTATVGDARQLLGARAPRRPGRGRAAPRVSSCASAGHTRGRAAIRRRQATSSARSRAPARRAARARERAEAAEQREREQRRRARSARRRRRPRARAARRASASPGVQRPSSPAGAAPLRVARPASTDDVREGRAVGDPPDRGARRPRSGVDVAQPRADAPRSR